MHRSTQLHRRKFLQQTTAAAAVGPLILSAARGGAEAPSERLNLGFIGVGTMGRGHVGAFLGYDDVQVVAVCDVVLQRRQHAQQMVQQRYAQRMKDGQYRGCAAYNDFRELLARDDLDAVVIATPDHWHAILCLQAAQRGLHIYCEKPLTHSIGEGRRIVEAVAKHGVIFQTGSQQRSEFGGKFRQAVELVRNGRLGRVKTVRIGVGGPAVPCDLPEQPVPDGTDWELWLGPAPQRGYNEILCPKGVHSHFPAWRNYREYAGGGLADMGAHHFDIAQWALDTDDTGPVKIEPPAQGGSGLRFVYAGGVEMFHGGPSGCTFEGELGTLYVDRSVLRSEPESILAQPLGPNDQRVYFSDNHRRNWLDCIRRKKQPICTAEIGHRSATICHLGNIGYWLRRPLTWDPQKEQFVGDDEANQLVLRQPRAPWTL